MLEQLIFDEGQLSALKEGINRLSHGEISAKQLKEQILQFRVVLLERLLEFFPFCVEEILKKRDSHSTSYNSNEVDRPEYEYNDIEEKNRLLEEIGIRISNLYRNIKNKMTQD